MSSYKVVEKFVSINGEGTRSGEVAVFIRFSRCNLSCSYCDTKWANGGDAPYEEETIETLTAYVEESGIKNVTLTGGEPLLQRKLKPLVKALTNIKDVRVEFETNGSVSIKELARYREQTGLPISFTLDYKLPSSLMESHMLSTNYNYIDQRDTVKFVSGSVEDLERAREVIMKYNLIGKTNLIVSPVFGEIELEEIVQFLLEYKLNDVKMQLQMHKFIWNPDQRGV